MIKASALAVGDYLLDHGAEILSISEDLGHYDIETDKGWISTSPNTYFLVDG